MDRDRVFGGASPIRYENRPLIRDNLHRRGHLLFDMQSDDLRHGYRKGVEARRRHIC